MLLQSSPCKRNLSSPSTLTPAKKAVLVLGAEGGVDGDATDGGRSLSESSAGGDASSPVTDMEVDEPLAKLRADSKRERTVSRSEVTTEYVQQTVSQLLRVVWPALDADGTASTGQALLLTELTGLTAESSLDNIISETTMSVVQRLLRAEQVATAEFAPPPPPAADADEAVTDIRTAVEQLCPPSGRTEEAALSYLCSVYGAAVTYEKDYPKVCVAYPLNYVLITNTCNEGKLVIRILD
ncbi:hypothetical protein FHG87_016485 [Trinorchestia longiramus]|nr:hypothetical protein FHG87_016485 [Trinorchestia longiramus]